MNCVVPSSYRNESAIRRELKFAWLGVVVDDLDQCERIHIHDTQSLLPSECQKLGIWRPGWLDYSCGQSGISTAFKDMRWFLFNPIVEHDFLAAKTDGDKLSIRAWYEAVWLVFSFN